MKFTTKTKINLLVSFSSRRYAFICPFNLPISNPIACRLAPTSFWPWRLINSNSNSNWQIDVVTTQKKPPTLETSWEFHSYWGELENTEHGRFVSVWLFSECATRQIIMPNSRARNAIERGYPHGERNNTSLTITIQRVFLSRRYWADAEGNEPHRAWLVQNRIVLYNTIVFP